MALYLGSKKIASNNTDDTNNSLDYELPIASTDTLGGIKIGNNLTIDEDGTLHAQEGSGSSGTSSYEAKEYDLTQYINPNLGDVVFTRTRCVNKFDRIVMDFVIRLTLPKNSNELLFILPDELMPSQSIEFVPTGNDGDTKIYGIGWLNKSNNGICVNLNNDLSANGYLRCCIVYDL